MINIRQPTILLCDLCLRVQSDYANIYFPRKLICLYYYHYASDNAAPIRLNLEPLTYKGSLILNPILLI